jgi:hypothetical protein
VRASDKDERREDGWLVTQDDGPWSLLATHDEEGERGLVNSGLELDADVDDEGRTEGGLAEEGAVAELQSEAVRDQVVGGT